MKIVTLHRAELTGQGESPIQPRWGPRCRARKISLWIQSSDRPPHARSNVHTRRPFLSWVFEKTAIELLPVSLHEALKLKALTLGPLCRF